MAEQFGLERGKSLYFRSPIHVLNKLHRELRRLRNATENHYGDDLDAIVNFAIAAWHLNDWLWIHNEAEICSLGLKSQSDLQAHFKKCRALNAFDVVCNAFKHGGSAHNRPDRPTLSSILNASLKDDGAVVYGSWMIVVDQQPVHAIVLCEEAYNWLYKFVQSVERQKVMSSASQNTDENPPKI